MPRDEPLDPPSHAAVADMVESALDCAVTAVDPFDEGLNAVYRVDRTDGEPLVVKAATFSTDDEILVEAAGLSRFGSETDVPVPRVHATLDADESGFDVAAVVTAYVHGRRLTDVHDLSPPEQERLVTESGRHLAEMHEVRLADGFGRLTLQEGRVVVDDPRFDSWAPWFRELVDDVIDGLAGEGYTTDPDPRFGDLASGIRETLARVATDEWTADPSLLVGDYRPANLVFASDSDADPLIRGVVDVGQGPTADGLLDLALAEDALVRIPFGGTDRADEFRRLLRRAYCRTRGVDRAVTESDRYDAYRLYARARRMAAFAYWVQFAHESDPDEAARRWRSSVRDLLDDLG